MALSDDTNAIVAAIQILRDRVTQLPLAIAQNAATAAADSSARGNAPKEKGKEKSSPGLVENALVSTFGRLLGPLATFATVLSATTSGASVFQKAISVLATALGPIILPAIFLLATGVIAASDVIFQKLLPALEGFFGFIIQTGMPAVVEFVDTVGRATSALIQLAESPIGKAVAGGDKGGGTFGGLNRTLDRLGGTVGLSEDPDKGRGVGSRIERATDDLARAVIPGGSRLVGAKDWLKRNLGMGGDEGGGGSAAGGAATAASGAVGRARTDVLREMMLSMGPKASMGNASSVWERAQMASLNQSPFERRMLEMMSAVVSRISRAESPGADPFAPRRPPAGGR